MSESLDRRTLLKGAAASAAAMNPLAEALGAQSDGLQFDPPVPFTYDLFKTMARDRAHAPYVPRLVRRQKCCRRSITRSGGRSATATTIALFANGPGRFPVTFFHLGLFFQKAVRMHVVDGGTSRQIVYDQSYFDMPANSPARELPKGAGFAGLRVQEARDGTLDWRKNDWVAFLGAAYFRSIGELAQYGLSSRGVALDVAVVDRSEEFPDFTEFYIEPGIGETITLYALMEGPSVVGAFKFLMTRAKGVVMDIQATLFTRAQVSRFGIAPLTSMYWYSETKKETAIDWRPEVHDFGRPCNVVGQWRAAMAAAQQSAANHGLGLRSTITLAAFGLLQRDRVFDHYLDGVFYDRRPSLWVEPLPGPSGEGWGKGSIQLCEIPTDDEIHDNVVAMWVPAEPIPAGAELKLNYRLHWLANEPYPSKLAPVWATRLGRGGQPGLPRPKGVRKFMVEFLGGPLAVLPFGVKPDLVVSASRGTFGPYQLIEAVPDGVAGHWRAQFDFIVDGTDPVELRAFLKSGGETALRDVDVPVPSFLTVSGRLTTFVRVS